MYGCQKQLEVIVQTLSYLHNFISDIYIFILYECIQQIGEMCMYVLT